jgi:hypothetical protein
MERENVILNYLSMTGMLLWTQTLTDQVEIVESLQIFLFLMKNVRGISSAVTNTLLNRSEHDCLINCLLAEGLNKDIRIMTIRCTVHASYESEGARRSKREVGE